MNQVVNKSLLVGNKFMPEMHLQQPGLIYTACGPFTKIKEELKNLCRQELQILFTKANLINLVFNMIWLMAKQKVYQKELSQTKF